MSARNEKTNLSEIKAAISHLSGRTERPIRIMEVCGTHTVAIFKHGIRSLLPENISLISGPGCPVCVTSAGDIDAAIEIAKNPDCILLTFGDMMRVPGSTESLYNARAGGADVRVVYSPLDALALAVSHPERKVVFFATGFETTAPLVAATIKQAETNGIKNFLVYSVHKLVPPALEALLSSGLTKIDGLILPGHVSAVIGSSPYRFIADKHGMPGVVTGFGANDILEGIFMLLSQIVNKRAVIEIQYSSVVTEKGNVKAKAIMEECFVPSDSYWRGIGTIPSSGLSLSEQYATKDASRTLGLDYKSTALGKQQEPKGCSCGEVLRGIKMPKECPLFGRACTPEKPVGACMVSSEGSCSAYFRYGSVIK